MTIRVVASIAAATLAFAIAAPAFAAARPDVGLTVSAQPTAVTRSRPAAAPPVASFAAYRVTITNNNKNVINHVHVVGATQVIGSSEKAAFAESIGVACAPLDAARTQVKCPVGQLRGRGGSATFTVLFKAPASGQKIVFSWQGIFAEGVKDNPSAAHRDTTGVGTTVTLLQAPSATQLKTFVPSQGATIFTGLSPIPTPHDQATTTVSVPKAASAEIIEFVNPQSCAADLLVCFTTDLTIPGTFANLVIKLRRDATTIRKYANIANAKVFYAADDIHFVEVQPCDCMPYNRPAPGKPCIESRTAYTYKTAPSAALVGDWEFTLLAVDNGRLNW